MRYRWHLRRLLCLGLGLVAFCTASAAPDSQWLTERFARPLAESGWTVDTSPRSAVRWESGTLTITGPLNCFAHIERPIAEDCVTATARLRPGIPSGISWSAGVFLYWAPGVWCQLSAADHEGGVLYTVEATGGQAAPAETLLRKADRSRGLWLRIELGSDCVRYLSHGPGEVRWTRERTIRRPKAFSGAPKLLIVGKGYGRDGIYPAPDLDNDYSDPGPPCQVRISEVSLTPTPSTRRKLGPSEVPPRGDAIGEAILAAPGDPTLEQVARVYPPMKHVREAVGPPFHPDEIGVTETGGLELGDATRDGKPVTMAGTVVVGSDRTPFGGGGGVRKSLQNDHLPIVVAAWSRGGLELEETVFATSDNWSTSAPLVGYVRLRARCVPEVARKVLLGFAGTPPEAVPGLSPRELTIEPGEAAAVYLRVTRSSTGAIAEWVPADEWDRALGDTISRWEQYLARGTQFDIPDPRVQNAWKAWLAYNAIDVDQVGRFREPHDGSGFYEAVFGYSAARYAMVLDLLGRHDEAADYLDTLMNAQDANGVLCWNFGLTDTGTLLIALAEHYRLTGDRDWFGKVAPAGVRACRWLAAQNRASRETPGIDPKVKGLIRYRSYCDYPEPVYSYFHNAYCCAGMERFSAALGKGDEGERIARNARLFRRDIEASMRASAIDVDGLRTLPMEPDTQRLLKDGNYSGGEYWGLIASCVLESEFLDPKSQEACLIAEFLRQRGGITLGTSEFAGGIDHAYGYGYQLRQLRNGNAERYLLGFYAALAYGMSRETFSSVEVTYLKTGENFPTLPHLYSGTQQLFLLRTMLVREEGDTLILCDAMPRAWLEPGKRTAVTNAATPWGPMSFVIESLKGHREISVRVDLPRRSHPEAVRVRVRTPDGSPIRSVRVNGAEWPGHTRDAVTLPPGRATCRVVVRY